ncbi:hypothetical protein BV25DRAFT_1843115 [Artomyces pyxidatus]|uniref:Uncharacterized protein n=1 Tax=Artomyces pyxidatus TaxID=48021 RepID=A0ACB8SFG0_9AGAM|nr:hypothetical protein BV25DRAFT_1843115 [Artomyces pyxidatus]
MNLGPPSRMQRCLTAIRNSDQNVLHWDVFGAVLTVWRWPLDVHGTLIAPVDLVGHREYHYMVFPLCLCALGPGGRWAESAVYRATAGPFEVNLERFYQQEGLHTKYYDVGDRARAAISVTNRAHLSEVSIRRTQTSSHAVYDSPALVAPTPFDLLLRLSQSQPGTTLEQFLGLFVQTTDVHNCAVPAGELGSGDIPDRRQ